LSKPVSRRTLLSSLVLAGALAPAALLLAGCPNPNTASNGTTGGSTAGASPAPAASGEAAASPAAAGAKKIKAGLVTDTGGINDRSFNQSAWEGLQKAQKDLGADIKYTESSKAADYVGNLTQFARAGYDIVFAVGFKMQDALKEVAPKFPNVKFAIIDGAAPDLPNCASYAFTEEQGSYLAGALAGLTSKSKKVGFIGGEQMPLIQKFEAGYIAGVKTTAPSAQVVTGYVGAFNDPQKGQELALSQIGAGADIIYHAAGESGVGVIKAVQGKGAGFYAIGVDKDQDGEAPGRVLTSMVKRVDTATFDACKSVATDSFKPGSTVLGLPDGGVGLSEMKYTKKDVPADAMKTVDALRQQIIDGKIKVPSTPDELKSFQAPKL
jgi:basic membrane protein A